MPLRAGASLSGDHETESAPWKTAPSAKNFRTVALSPWLLIPVLFVVVTVMAFMFLGDGLRDAADPYKKPRRCRA